MKNKKGMFDLLQDLVWVGQLGLNLMMPLLLCLVLCWWLNTRFSIGLWVYIPGFLLGLGGGWNSALQFFRLSQKRAQQQEKPVAFNRHG